MLEYLKSNFQELLQRLEGDICPICGVVRSHEIQEIKRLCGTADSLVSLCGTHLNVALSLIDEPRGKARRTRRVIEVSLTHMVACQVCKRLGAIEARLARAIRGLDGSMRFKKALETAPMFCQEHASLFDEENLAPNFLQVQHAKLVGLRDGLAQAELRNAEGLGTLISQALTYLTPWYKCESRTESEDSENQSAVNAAEFERWEQTRLIKHLGNLESELASLRYRNAVISEENRRLTLARTASEAIRCDLERDREQLLAALKQSTSSKSSNDY